MSQYYPGALPRRTRYGQDDAWQLGLTPLDETDLDIIAWEDMEECITDARQAESMPIFHQHDTCQISEVNSSRSV